MSRNVEIKARISNPDKILNLVKKCEDIKADRVLYQEDVFFHTPNGRLKLRKIQDENESQLIYYDRLNSKGPRISDYHIAKCSDTSNLLQVLGKSLGIKGCVKKTRHLLIIGQTRVHIDRVEGLGDFLELEVVLSNEQSEADGQQIVAQFMKFLQIKEEDLIDCAYMDLPKH